MRLVSAAIEKHAHRNVEKLALGIITELRRAGFEIVRRSNELLAEATDGSEIRGMNWTKATIFAVLIVTAIIVAIHYRKLAGAVVLPLTLVALYSVWHWGREA